MQRIGRSEIGLPSYYFYDEFGTDGNKKSKRYGTVLHAACAYADYETFQQLIDRRADVNSHGRYGTPLATAVRAERLDLVKILLNNGADPAKKSAGHNAIEVAKLMGHIAVSRFLSNEVRKCNPASLLYNTFLTGMHPRLGASSRVKDLHNDVLVVIARWVLRTDVGDRRYIKESTCTCSLLYICRRCSGSGPEGALRLNDGL